MSAWRGETESRIVEALGGGPAAWITWGEPLPRSGAGLASLVLSFVGSSPPAAERVRLLAGARAALVTDGWLVVVDHNRPRRPLGAALALVLAPAVPGVSPRTRWRRLAYPTAREVHAAGYHVVGLRLAAAERVQIVIARASSPRATSARGDDGAPNPTLREA